MICQRKYFLSFPYVFWFLPGDWLNFILSSPRVIFLKYNTSLIVCNNPKCIWKKMIMFFLLQGTNCCLIFISQVSVSNSCIPKSYLCWELWTSRISKKIWNIWSSKKCLQTPEFNWFAKRKSPDEKKYETWKKYEHCYIQSVMNWLFFQNPIVVDERRWKMILESFSFPERCKCLEWHYFIFF